MANKPTSFLPLLRRDTPHAAIEAALARLESLASSENVNDRAELDDFEKNHAKSWLTRLLKLAVDNEDPYDDTTQNTAAELLGLLSRSGERRPFQRVMFARGVLFGSSDDASPTGTDDEIRVHTFQAFNGSNVDVSIRSTHMQDVDATGFCTWSSGIVLASMLLRDPAHYLGTSTPYFKCANGSRRMRVLELGSGTGLAGIAAAKALALQCRQADVTLSDYEAQTLTTLQQNVEANTRFAGSELVRIEVKKLAWEDYQQSAEPAVVTSLPSVAHKYDVILGADIVYELEHGKLVHNVVTSLLAEGSVFHLVIPLRHTHQQDVERFEACLEKGTEERSERQLHVVEQRDLEELGEGRYRHRYYRIAKSCMAVQSDIRA